MNNNSSEDTNEGSMGDERKEIIAKKLGIETVTQKDILFSSK